MDGWVTIGTRVDSKQLEKDLKDAESQLRQYEKEAEKLTKSETRAQVDLQDYYEKKQLIEEMTNKSLEYAQTEKEVNYELELEQQNLQKLNDAYSTELSKLDEIKTKIQQNAVNQSLMNEKVSELNTKINQTKGFEKIKKSIDDVGNSMSKTIKKVAKWGLAIFGVRSAYMFVRQAMSTLSQYDDVLASDIEYIRYVLANSLKPVIETIINLVYKLLAYIGYIAKAWFGVNLFANASAKAFKKQKDSLGGSVKKAKELEKTMAGFDEMNVLQDTSDKSGGGGGGTALPSVDLGNMADIPIPGWIKWIADNGEFVAGVLAGITTALILMKTLGLDPIMAIGIGAIVMGVMFLIQDIIDMINDPSWQNFVAILGDIAIVIGGIMLVMGNWWGLLVVIIGAVVKLVAENWDKIKEILSKVWEWVYDNIIEPVADLFRELWEIIKTIFGPVISFFTSIFRTVWTNIKIIFNDIAQIFSFLWDKLKAIFTPVADFFKSVFTKAFGFIKTVFSPIVNFFADIWTKVSGKLKSFGAKVGEVVAGAFKGVVNGVLGAIENILNSPIKAINGLIKTINKVPGIDLDKLKEFKLPRLAKGGIVNNPGPGVMMGSYIAGERGPEAVIPLDDETLDRLGLAFARHTVINATMINQMNGRVISRELQKINSENDFAFNR